MNKIFTALLFLTLVGAGILFWLMKTLPPSPSSAAHDKSEKSEVISTPDGVKVGDLKAEGEEHAEGEKAPGEKGSAEKSQSHEAEKSDADDVKSMLSIMTTPVVAKVFVDGEIKGKTPLEIKLTHKEQAIKLVADGFNDMEKEAPPAKAEGPVENLRWNIALRAKKGSLKEPPHRDSLGKKGQKHEKAEKIETAEKPTQSKPLDDKGALAALPKPVHSEPLKVESAKKVEETHVAKNSEAHVEKETHPETHTDKHPGKPAVAKAHEAKEAPPKMAASNAAESLYLHGRGGPVWIQVKALETPTEVAAKKEIVEPAIEKFRSDLKGMMVVGCQVDLAGHGRWTRILVGPFENKVEARTALGQVKKSTDSAAFVTGAQTCL